MNVSLRAGLVASLLSGAWLVLLVFSVPTGQQVETWTTVFEQQQSRAEVVVAQMDGQAFAQQAADPTMSDLDAAYLGDRQQAAYRSARPVQGWVNWVGSGGGQRAAIAPAMLVVGVLALGLLPLAIGSVARTFGRAPRLPELVLFAPACIAFLRWPGLCEPLAAVLVLFGLARWRSDERWLGVGLFALAALTRETSLLVPVGLGLATLVQHRRLRPALPLVIPALAYALWGGVVRLRVGVFPTGSAQMGVPLEGLTRALPHWHLAEALTFLALAVALVLMWRTSDLVMRAMVVAHGAFLAFLGPLVWWYWWGFGRVTLPVFALALVSVASKNVAADGDAAGSDDAVGSTSEAEHTSDADATVIRA